MKITENANQVDTGTEWNGSARITDENFHQIMRKNMRLTSGCSSTLNPGKLPYRILYFGTDHFAVTPLRRLVENSRSTKDRIIENIEVVCPPERRRVLNKKLFDSNKHVTVREYALSEGLQIHYWRGKEGWNNDYRLNSPYDIGIVASFGYLITNKVLDLCLRGSINIHPSLLPQWRGASPMSYSILEGAKETGVSIVELSKNKFDLGKILLQEKVPLPNDIMFDNLSIKLASVGTKMLFDALSNLDECLRNARPQSSIGLSYAPKMNKEHGYVNWEEHTWEYIWRKWRTLSTRVGLHTKWSGKMVRLVSMTPDRITNVSDNESNATPGQPKFEKERGILFIKCKDDWVGFTQLQVECKSIITAKDFSNSYLQLRYSKQNVFESMNNKPLWKTQRIYPEQSNQKIILINSSKKSLKEM